MGDLLVAPLLLLAWTRPRIRRRRHLGTEATFAFVALAMTVTVVFLTRRSVAELGVPAYLLFPVLVLIAARFAQYGAAIANFLAAAATIAFTALGYGPFVRSAGLAESLLQLQMLMGVLATTTVWWPKFSPNQRNINWTTSDRLADFNGGSTFYTNLVMIEPDENGEGMPISSRALSGSV